MSENYWDDYTQFINVIEASTGFSPTSLLDFYTEFVESLEQRNWNNYTMFEYELDNDFYIRTLIQVVLDSEVLANNQLKREFEDKVKNLDSRIKEYLSEECKNRVNWYMNIELNIKDK